MSINKIQLAIEDLNSKGFSNLGVLFTSKEIAVVRNAFKSAVENPSDAVKVIRESESNAIRSIMGWQNANQVLERFSRDGRVVDPVKKILGDDIVFHQTKYNPKQPGGKGEKWDPHRGITFWNLLDGIQQHERIMSVFIALTEQTEQNGATYTWSGAHALDLEEIRKETVSKYRNQDASGDTASYLSLQIQPDKLKKYESQYERISLIGDAGSVWLLDSRNLHASQPNSSNEVRDLVANVFRTVKNVPTTPRPERFLCETSDVPIDASYLKLED